MTDRILKILDNVRYWDTCPDDYKKDIEAFLEAQNQALRIHDVGGSTSLSEEEIENQIEIEEYEDSLWNDLEDDLTGLTYPEVDETLFAIESNFPPSNLTEEQWNRERS